MRSELIIIRIHERNHTILQNADNFFSIVARKCTSEIKENKSYELLFIVELRDENIQSQTTDLAASERMSEIINYYKLSKVTVCTLDATPEGAGELASYREGNAGVETLLLTIEDNTDFYAELHSSDLNLVKAIAHTMLISARSAESHTTIEPISMYTNSFKFQLHQSEKTYDAKAKLAGLIAAKVTHFARLQGVNISVQLSLLDRRELLVIAGCEKEDEEEEEVAVMALEEKQEEDKREDEEKEEDEKKLLFKSTANLILDRYQAIQQTTCFFRRFSLPVSQIRQNAEHNPLLAMQLILSHAKNNRARCLQWRDTKTRKILSDLLGSKYLTLIEESEYGGPSPDTITEICRMIACRHEIDHEFQVGQYF